mgnify:CR=1 FL=1
MTITSDYLAIVKWICKAGFILSSNKRYGSAEGEQMEEDEEDKFGDVLIKPTSFYSAKHEKTKLNWFCYESALSFELEIKRKLGNALINSW